MSAQSILLSKKITRKEFLLTVGTFILLMTGVAGIIEKIRHFQTSGSRIGTKPFGSGPYGV